MTAHVLLIKRDHGALTPARAADAEALAAYPKGAAIKASLTLPKSPDMLRWYWALIGHVSKGIGRDKEALSHELLLRTGRFESLVLSTGREHFIPASIGAMQYPQFKGYVDEAVELILQDFCAGIRRADLLREIARMTGTNYADFPAAEAEPETSSEGGPRPGTDEAVEEVDGSRGPDASLGQDMSSASSIFARFSQALGAVGSGGPRALMAAKKNFVAENADEVKVADAEMANGIYAAHSRRLNGEIDAEGCAALVDEIIGGAQ